MSQLLKTADAAVNSAAKTVQLAVQTVEKSTEVVKNTVETVNSTIVLANNSVQLVDKTVELGQTTVDQLKKVTASLGTFSENATNQATSLTTSTSGLLNTTIEGMTSSTQTGLKVVNEIGETVNNSAKIANKHIQNIGEITTNVSDSAISITSNILSITESFANIISYPFSKLNNIVKEDRIATENYIKAKEKENESLQSVHYIKGLRTTLQNEFNKEMKIIIDEFDKSFQEKINSYNLSIKLIEEIGNCNSYFTGFRKTCDYTKDLDKYRITSKSLQNTLTNKNLSSFNTEFTTKLNSIQLQGDDKDKAKMIIQQYFTTTSEIMVNLIDKITKIDTIFNKAINDIQTFIDKIIDQIETQLVQAEPVKNDNKNDNKNGIQLVDAKLVEKNKNNNDNKNEIQLVDTKLVDKNNNNNDNEIPVAIPVPGGRRTRKYKKYMNRKKSNKKRKYKKSKKNLNVFFLKNK